MTMLDDSDLARDISVIITAHSEGRLAHHSMQSLFRSIAFAEDSGIRIGIVVVMDRADEPTKRYFSEYEGRPGVTLLPVDCGDPGLARNEGILRVRSEYIAVMDSDNLFCLNWLKDAYEYLRKAGHDVIAHPEYHYTFEAQSFLVRQISSTDSRFNPLYLIDTNFWDTVCMARRDIFVRFPYKVTIQGEGFGHEDWLWNCETLAEGIEHEVIPETVHYYRYKKSGSNMQHNNSSHRLIRPNRLFDPAVMKGRLSKSAADTHER